MPLNIASLQTDGAPTSGAAPWPARPESNPGPGGVRETKGAPPRPFFSLLSNPAAYYPCTENMLVDTAFRNYWLDHFVWHFDLIIRLAGQTYGPAGAARATACRAALAAELELLRKAPGRYGELNLQVLGLIRQKYLQQFDVPDPFLLAKQRENDAMLKLYPALIAEIDRHVDPLETLRLLVEGVFAGNIFDLGATATAGMFAGNSPDFFQIRADLDGKRPWLVDHFDAFAQSLLNPPGYRHALFFMDNAGSDAVLGVFPLARWLAQRGVTVCLLANEHPALNDMTIVELHPLLASVRKVDRVFNDMMSAGRIRAASSGGATPLLDLRCVSEECNAHAAAADLIFLEGMGRGLESNFQTPFHVAAVKLCMIKEEIIAQRHGGKVFDVVFRFDPAS